MIETEKVNYQKSGIIENEGDLILSRIKNKLFRVKKNWTKRDAYDLDDI